MDTWGARARLPCTEEPVVVPPEDRHRWILPDTGTITPNDKMADSGKLFGDLYVILRQQGIIGDLTQGIPGDKKLVPDTNFNSIDRMRDRDLSSLQTREQPMIR